MKTYRIISRALLYDHPYMGWTYHIVIHKVVEIPDLKHYMLCPMKFRTNGAAVNYCPRFLTDHTTEKTHDIVAYDEWGKKFVST